LDVNDLQPLESFTKISDSNKSTKNNLGPSASAGRQETRSGIIRLNIVALDAGATPGGSSFTRLTMNINKLTINIVEDFVFTT
jgi:hypothetical protein